MGKMNNAKDYTEFAKRIKESINCLLPARVVSVNDDGTVNVVAIRNDEIEDCVITVPVLRPETARAYIQFAIKSGDRGIVKFCDKSIESYRTAGSEEYNHDNRNHSLSDGIFQLGFLPDSEKFVFPQGEVIIGLKNDACNIIIDESGNLTIKSNLVTINSSVVVNGDIHATGIISSDTDVLSAGISGNGHTHTGNAGVPTSAPIK